MPTLWSYEDETSMVIGSLSLSIWITFWDDFSCAHLNGWSCCMVLERVSRAQQLCSTALFFCLLVIIIILSTPADFPFIHFIIGLIGPLFLEWEALWKIRIKQIFHYQIIQRLFLPSSSVRWFLIEMLTVIIEFSFCPPSSNLKYYTPIKTSKVSWENSLNCLSSLLLNSLVVIYLCIYVYYFTHIYI